MCHLGSALNSGPGSVKIVLPGEATYTPGVKQRIAVEVSDPSQRRWGFELSARLKSAEGRLLIGNAALADWRARAKRGAARVRMDYDTHPSADSTLTLDPSTKNAFGDPLPKIVHRLDAATEARLPETKRHLTNLFDQLARANNGKVLSTSEGGYLDHPAGGCRMGVDPASSVCDSFGRTHDHRNLFVVGSPTLPTAGCTNGTLTFAAVTLRSANEIATSVG